jgi:hypothetical protein
MGKINDQNLSKDYTLIVFVLDYWKYFEQGGKYGILKSSNLIESLGIRQNPGESDELPWNPMES